MKQCDVYVNVLVIIGCFFYCSNGLLFPHRDNMQCLIQQHTYARSPLRSYTDSEFDDPVKSPYGFVKGKHLSTQNNTVVLWGQWVIIKELGCVTCYSLIM